MGKQEECLLESANHSTSRMANRYLRFQALGQLSNVGMVQVRSRLVQSKDTTVYRERLCKGQSNDNGGKNLLTGTASATHVQSAASLDHHDSVVVRLVGPHTFLVRSNLDGVNVYQGNRGGHLETNSNTIS